MKDSCIHIHDKVFKLCVSQQEIEVAVQAIARKIDALNVQQPLFIAALNGAYMFAAELCKRVACMPYVSFVKVASYNGLHSSGVVQSLLGLDTDVKGKTIFLIEDIIDTGNTIQALYNEVMNMGAERVFIVSLFFKPQAYTGSVNIDYIGVSIPNDFVVGYGMDYNGLGRNLPDLYVLHSE